MNNIDYSVVVPVFNSQNSLEELFTRIKSTFEKLEISFEVVFVEDGGSDNSWDVIEKLKQTQPELITAIKLAKNFGQHNALFCGIQNSKGNYIITIDDDLQIPPEEIEKLINTYKKNESDLVYGYFKIKKHSWYRNIGSILIKKISKYLFNAPGRGSSFRLLKNDLAQKLLSHYQNFVYIDELLLWYTDNISFVEVEHHKRKDHYSGYSPYKLFKLTTNIVIYYTAVPLKMMVYGGLLSSVICFLIGLLYIYKKLRFNVELGFTSIIVSIFFSTSIILLSLGIIGEYLKRIYTVQNKKPLYSIKKIL